MFPKSLTILGHRPFVNGFFKKFPQYKQFKTFSPKPFTDLVHAFHEDFIEEVINSREGVDMPLKMGNLKIISYKPNNNYLNFSRYRQGEITKFVNNHTEGLSGKIVYSNYSNRYKLKDKSIWSFEPEVPFKKKVSVAFIVNYLRYSFSPNRGKIKYLRTEISTKEINDKKIKDFLKTYDEFSIS